MKCKYLKGTREKGQCLKVGMCDNFYDCDHSHGSKKAKVFRAWVRYNLFTRKKFVVTDHKIAGAGITSVPCTITISAPNWAKINGRNKCRQ